jgi:hypothetical protein
VAVTVTAFISLLFPCAHVRTSLKCKLV